jgi:hypothetical protein
MVVRYRYAIPQVYTWLNTSAPEAALFLNPDLKDSMSTRMVRWRGGLALIK